MDVQNIYTVSTIGAVPISQDDTLLINKSLVDIATIKNMIDNVDLRRALVKRIWFH